MQTAAQLPLGPRSYTKRKACLFKPKDGIPIRLQRKNANEPYSCAEGKHTHLEPYHKTLNQIYTGTVWTATIEMGHGRNGMGFGVGSGA